MYFLTTIKYNLFKKINNFKLVQFVYVIKQILKLNVIIIFIKIVFKNGQIINKNVQIVERFYKMIDFIY